MKCGTVTILFRMTNRAVYGETQERTVVLTEALIMRIPSMRIACIALMVLLLAMPISANEFEDFAKGEMAAFAQYRDERDAEFVGFLKAQWAEFDVSRGFVRDRVSKPERLPVAAPPEVIDPDPEAKPADPGMAVGDIVLPVLPLSLPPESELSGEEDPALQVPDTALPVPPIVETPLGGGKLPMEETMLPVGLSVPFYGDEILFSGTFSFETSPLGDPLKPSIAAYWEAMSRESKFESFVSQAQAVRKRLSLNDWGYHNLLFASGMVVHGGNKDLANLFTWFMSVKSGFDARIGYSDARVYLLLPSRNRLYSVSYLTIKGIRYYAMTFDGTREKLGSVYTYKGKYLHSDRLVDYRILAVPELKADIHVKTLAFDFKGEPQSLNISYNKSLVDYYQYYPQTNIKIYFDAVASEELNYSMVRELKAKLEGKSEKDAVDYLLILSQKGFAYKTDDAQLGHEKYMLPEETLWYPYSDCEDRSFLFSYLVRRILKLDVVGLNYPGHVATAVRFSENVPGDYVVMNNRKYIVCDPTYINASAGMAMPKYKRGKPGVVKIRSWQ